MTVKFLESLENSVAILKQAGLFTIIKKKVFMCPNVFLLTFQKNSLSQEFSPWFRMFMANKNEINV